MSIEKETMELQITPEEFKLIKGFYPEFTRKPGIQSNDYIIGWSELMPVVGEIWKRATDDNAPVSHTTHAALVFRHVHIFDHIEKVCNKVVEYIKWYNYNK